MDRIKDNLSKYIMKTCLIGGGSFVVGFFAYYLAKNGEKTTLETPETNSNNIQPTGNEREIPINVLEKMVAKVKNRVILTLASHFDKASTFIGRKPINLQQPLIQPLQQQSLQQPLQQPIQQPLQQQPIQQPLQEPLQQPLQPPQQSDIIITTMNTGEAARNNIEETKDAAEMLRREGYKSFFQGI
jgi:hypothetical protein